MKSLKERRKIKMKKTLVVMAHPDMKNSRANKAFKEEAEKLSSLGQNLN